MDFQISDRIQTIVSMINEFVDKELIPLEPEFMTNSFESMLPVLKEKQTWSGKWSCGRQTFRWSAAAWGFPWWNTALCPKPLPFSFRPLCVLVPGA